MSIPQVAYGFHEPEKDDCGPFIWSQKNFGLRRTKAGGYAFLHLCYNGEEGTLMLTSAGSVLDSVRLRSGWNWYCLNLAGTDADELHFSLDRIIPVEGDGRELGVAVRHLDFGDDAELAGRLRRRLENARLNQQEFLSGEVALRSCPPRLRINIETRCNIKSPCVYCEWDEVKRMENASVGLTRGMIEQMGEFYDAAVELVDCGFGEPLLNREIHGMISDFHRCFKHFEMTSNGQLLTESHRRSLMGRDLWLYISLDSATAQGYARYRMGDFDLIAQHVGALCREKKAHGDLPRAVLAFIMMRSNVGELGDFLRMAKGLGVDAVKLRSLFCDAKVTSRKVIRPGFEFDYDAETLTTGEVRSHTERARALAREIGLPLLVDFDFGNEASDVTVPLCAEPWTSLYVLNRGIMPCCFAKEPFAKWEEQGNRSVSQFLRDVLNGPRFRKLRAALRTRTLPDFCMRCTSCPIVRRRAPSI